MSVPPRPGAVIPCCSCYCGHPIPTVYEVWIRKVVRLEIAAAIRKRRIWKGLRSIDIGDKPKRKTK